MSTLLDKLFDILNPQPTPASNIIEDLNQKVLDVKNDIQVSRTQLISFFEKMLGCEYGGIIQEVATAEGGKFYDDNITSKLYLMIGLLSRYQQGGHPNALPPKRWICKCLTVCPPSSPVLATMRNPFSLTPSFSASSLTFPNIYRSSSGSAVIIFSV